MDLNKIELLAPAGKWDVLEQVIDSGADAVYLGGKVFNMRMLKPEYNFSDREIKDAVHLLHDKNKKLYITVNNLYNDQEISQLKDYITWLEQIGADGLIVQDMGIVHIHQELGAKIPLHASVQMGIGNAAAVTYLEELGFSRAILSKNLTIDEIREIHNNTDLEIEFFAHGDLCISHTGQCYLSSFISGNSANKGRCIKPCRWQYALSENEPFKYLLASNDLCLYPYLDQLIKAGVISFKIEGRMREKEYLAHLISIYRRAIDLIKDDIKGYSMDQGQMDKLNKGRIRDFTPGSLFGIPVKDAVDTRGEREPFFISEPAILQPMVFTDQPLPQIEENICKGQIKELTVKTGSLKSAVAAINSGADNLIIGLDHFRQGQEKWDRESIKEALAAGRKAGVQLWLETPHIVTQNDLNAMIKLADDYQSNKNVDGIIINDYGSLKIFRDLGYQVSGGPGLNITNGASALTSANNGLGRITASPELDYESLKTMLISPVEIELIIQGPLCGMITDYCLTSQGSFHDNCSAQCLESSIGLLDKWGQIYKIRTDSHCRNYLYHPYDLCLYYYLELLKNVGLQYVRIDGQFYNEHQVAEITAIYRRAIDRLNHNEKWSADDYRSLFTLLPQGLTSMPLM
jgi:putative protease